MSNILTTISADPRRLSPFSAVISGRLSRGNNLNTLLYNLEKGYLRTLIATIHYGRILQHLRSHREAIYSQSTPQFVVNKGTRFEKLHFNTSWQLLHGLLHPPVEVPISNYNLLMLYLCHLYKYLHYAIYINTSIVLNI